MNNPQPKRRSRYSRFAQLDGAHPLREAAPEACVAYHARLRHDGEVAFFNFGLAREMGLIARSHPDQMNAELERALLQTFCLVIINEFDFLHGLEVAPGDHLPHTYMATRYLQLQHPGRVGQTSGDGRSIWNGRVRHRGKAWDVSSCGTGVTRLCPATAENDRFYRTGTRIASYGCGTAALQEGIGSALMSETFHHNGIDTERVLCVISLPRSQCITVRASRNLLRPSHFFVHLKQGKLEPLRGAVDVFIDRQIGNGDWPALARPEHRYRFMAEEMARTFARMAARFESEYIFCWLDWDGDNILANGGIIDYGSIRQFGLYHREYRFEDVDRMSTTIPEQRRKARYIAQGFAQIRDFLVTGQKPPLRGLAHDPVLALFDAEFESERERRLLYDVGFTRAQIRKIVRFGAREIAAFRRAHAYFERARSSRGPVRVPDGLSWNAIYSTRDLLRELPARLAAGDTPDPREILEIAASSYCSRKDRELRPHRRRMARAFVRSYAALVEVAAEHTGRSPERIVRDLAARAAVIDRPDRITGDGVDWATRRLIRQRKRLGVDGIYRVVRGFVARQNLVPEGDGRRASTLLTDLRDDERAVVESLIKVVGDLREGL